MNPEKAQNIMHILFELLADQNGLKLSGFKAEKKPSTEVPVPKDGKR